MPRKSKREIERAVDELEPNGQIPEDVDVFEQWFSDEYPDPPQDQLGEAWAAGLRGESSAEE